MRESKGNMYGWVSHTWNPVTGKCKHSCEYCYMKKFPQKELRLKESILDEDLGSGNFIFVCSSTDLFADNVPDEWIKKVIDKCKQHDNHYLFQSKNPERMLYFDFPEKTTVGTTVETNRFYKCMGNAPLPLERLSPLVIRKFIGNKIMVTIEPILDFDSNLIDYLRFIKPDWVNIGADSKGHNLPEPCPEKIKTLISELRKFTEIRKKSNLSRLMSDDKNDKDAFRNNV